MLILFDAMQLVLNRSMRLEVPKGLFLVDVTIYATFGDLMKTNQNGLKSLGWKAIMTGFVMLLGLLPLAESLEDPLLPVVRRTAAF